MKNKLLILFILSLVVIAPLSAGIQYEVNSFHAGSADFNLGFNTDWLYGSRGDALRMGGAQSTLDFNPSFTSYNPAVLAYIPSGTVSIELVPYDILSSNLVGLFIDGGVNKILKTNGDDALASVFKNVTLSAGVSTDLDSVSAYVGQSAGFTGFEIMVPFAKGQASFAFARENKTSVDLSIMITGLEAQVHVSDPDLPANDIDLSAKLDAIANFNSDNIVTSFGVGRKLTPEWGIGCVAEHYDSRFVVDAQASVGGTATFNGTTESFNTDEHNSLAQTAYADLTGDAWGLRFGTSYHFFKDSIELGADFSIEPEISYKGKPEILYHTLPSSIDTSDFTKTVAKSVDDANGTLKMKLPSYARFTFGWKAGMAGNINYTHYFDGYSMKFKSPTDDMEFNLDMMDALRIGFNFGYFQIGGGAIYSKVYEKNNGELKMLQYFVLPVLSTGVVIPVGDYLKWEVELFAIPLPALKTAITYTFL